MQAQNGKNTNETARAPEGAAGRSGARRACDARASRVPSSSLKLVFLNQGISVIFSRIFQS
jgi:hypothetical protein